MDTIRTTTRRRRRSFVKIGVATVTLVATATMTAACGADPSSPTAPADVPVEARIYPPTDVPEVRPGPDHADAGEQRPGQNEEMPRRQLGRPPMP